MVLLLVSGRRSPAAGCCSPHRPKLPERMMLTLDLRDEVAGCGGAHRSARLPLGLPRSRRSIELITDARAGRARSARQGSGARVSMTAARAWRRAQELARRASRAFARQGKFAYAYADSFGEFGPGTRGYYLATAFDEIHLQPLGALGLTGVLIETPLLRGLLDQLGIEPARRQARASTRTPPTRSPSRELTPAAPRDARSPGEFARSSRSSRASPRAAT